MSIKSFKKKYIHEHFQGVLTLNFQTRIDFSSDFSSDFLLEKSPEELKYLFRRTLEDMRIKFLSNFDVALLELEKEQVNE